MKQILINQFSKQETIVRYNIIIKLTQKYNKPSFSQIKYIDSLILSKIERRVVFPFFDLIVKDDSVLFEKSVEDKEITFIIDNSCDITKNINQFKFCISQNLSEADNKVLKIADEYLFFPLIFRNWTNSDALKTAGGKVLVNKLISSWKIDENKRKNVYVLEDRKGIVAVFAHHVGGRDRLAMRMKNTLVGKRVRLYSIFNKEIDGETI